MIVLHNDGRLSWQGAVSLERTDYYTRPWRIPHSEIALFPGLARSAVLPAGVRLNFLSSTRRLAGRIIPHESNRTVDLWIDHDLVGSADLTGAEDFVFEDLPPGEKHFELWLPHGGEFALRHLEIDSDAEFAACPDVRARWITYGSSITQCVAASPSRTWPALVARKRNLNLTCLGYGGNCHLDIQVARMMRDLPADFISICAGINIYGQATLSRRTFPSALIGFVQILREKHPNTKILLISPIYCRPRETTPNAVGWTLNEYRSSVEEVSEVLRSTGDGRIRYLNGLKLIGEEQCHFLPDELHPNAEGYEILAGNFLTHASPLLFDAS